MTLYLNPLVITLTLMEKENCLLILPYTLQPNNPLNLRDHLQSLAARVQQAAQRKYSFMNALPSTPFPKSSPRLPHVTTIPNLITLVKQLNSWIMSHKSFITSSCSEPFFKEVSRSLLLTHKLLEDPENPFSKKASSSSNSPRNPKKRWIEEHNQQEASCPKQARASVDDSTITIKALEDIQEATPLLPIYLVHDIVMLDDSAFTFTPQSIQDLETWMRDFHQHVGSIITNAELSLVDTPTDVHAIKYENLINLRRFSLESLLSLMQKNQTLINSIVDPKEKKDLQRSHTQLIADLKTSLDEIISQEQTSTLMASQEIILSLTPASLEKQPRTPSKQSSSSEHLLLGLHVSSKSFNLSAITIFSNATRFKKFLNQIEKASYLSKYTSETPISCIAESVTNNSLLVLQALYYIVSRNFFCFRTKHSISTILEALITFTLNNLNLKYCTALKIDADLLNHHKDLLKLIVSSTNPPQPLSQKDHLCYISVYLDNKNNLSVRIQATMVHSPHNQDKRFLKNWLLSLQKHKTRAISILQKSLNTPLLLVCTNDSWQLHHDIAKPVTQNLLIQVFRDISLHNLKVCSSHFMKKETKLPGYRETQNLLLSIEKILHEPITNSLIIEENIIPINPIEKSNSSSKDYFCGFFTLLRDGSTYIFQTSHPMRSKKQELIKSFSLLGDKLSHHLNNIFMEPSFPKIKEAKDSKEVINASLFVALFYLGAEYNLHLSETKFENTFLPQKISGIHVIFKNALQKFKDLKETLQKKWKELEPGKPMPLLESIQHPVAQAILLLYQQLNPTNQDIIESSDSD